MIKNYLKIAWRNLMKNKTFSFINIAGLSIGMAACLLILQYVSFELNYDQFNKNAPDIYRVVNDRYQNGKLIQHGTITYSAIGKAMKDDYPEVVNYTRWEPLGDGIIIYNDKKIGNQQSFAVDNSFLSMFTYSLIAGNLQTALKEPNTLVISESTAKKVFDYRGNDFQTLIDRTVTLGGDSSLYKITGVCKDVPENSHIQFDFLISYSTLYNGKNAVKQADYDFTASDYWLYIQLKHGTNYKTLQSKFDAFSRRHFQENKISGSDEKFYLQPLLRAHLYSGFQFEICKTGSATMVWSFLLIALFIIVIAWVNYINLSTARSIERAKEVGVRKVIGASKRNLIKQFLAESFLINLTALLIAITIINLVQKPFNGLIQHNLSLSILFENGLTPYNITIGVIILIVTGIFVSGFYPAFVLSSFKPASVLKGKYSTSQKGIVLRKALVIGQFAITVVLIIASFVVYKQVSYMNDQKLGMNIYQTLIVSPPRLSRGDSTFVSKETSFKEEVKQIANVKGVATSWRVAGEELGKEFDVRRTDATENTHFIALDLGVDADYINVYSIKLLAGRNFEATDFNTDWDNVHNIILNEVALKLLGFSNPKPAIGKTILTGTKRWDVIGVIANFHQKSLRYPIEPTLLMPRYDQFSRISVKVDPKNVAATITAIKAKYNIFFPGNLFDYYFLDEKFNQQYSNDQLFGKVFAIFAGFAIFIACLGLLGLSLFATTQRTKEIGVRKVLGASVSNIVVLLSKDFIKLIIVAFVIASPVAWWIMNNWLQDFAYRINISWWIFFAAGLIAIIIALVTISFQAIKAAIANPVKSLRAE
jgi:putative ABC transport system permease protein